ncbi:acyltransferase [Solwaraspora sp. WMMD406]|uniref:acyltransferase family protein n=1 Tax=Solwaraspora sp. WMMD406 TaxID=3016095 RepID=UPI002415F99A|nr:acyltransferase [Solwaraspora sp. WMMD406]MDG4767033.1 acyltransferase [Solwaraspora sp. WMMD406]
MSRLTPALGAVHGWANGQIQPDIAGGWAANPTEKPRNVQMVTDIMSAPRTFDIRRFPRLADRFDVERNSFGLIRLVFALGVLLAHARPLGYALAPLGARISANQSDLGTLAVQGFFVLSGFLVAGSALRHSLPRYLWHRTLRIFPAFWTCLLVTALIMAPLVALAEGRPLREFWTHHEGPISYLATNWFTSMNQFTISGLLSQTPYGQAMGGPSAFDGSLWTLRYELACYLLVGVLAATAVLRQAPRALIALLAGTYILILRDFAAAPGWAVRPAGVDQIGPFPLIGSFAPTWLLYFSFLFLLGATARVYMHRIPMDGKMAAVAAAIMTASLVVGGFAVVGLPCLAYLVIFAGVALPERFTRIGRKRDYSYGIYVYGFPVQQIVALFGGAQLGLTGYIALSLAGTLALAAASWHLIEEPAMTLRNATPSQFPTPFRRLSRILHTPASLLAAPRHSPSDKAAEDPASTPIPMRTSDEEHKPQQRPQPKHANETRILEDV